MKQHLPHHTGTTSLFATTHQNFIHNTLQHQLATVSPAAAVRVTILAFI